MAWYVVNARGLSLLGVRVGSAAGAEGSALVRDCGVAVVRTAKVCT
jgi:hypothetical protein